jgi:mannose-6-phosphate isomerase
MPWGGRKWARFLGKNMPSDGPYGESWEVSDHALHQSRLATASGFGITLRELIVKEREHLLGRAAARFNVFPWLIKFLDAEDWLSVQVHPDEYAVEKLSLPEGAKTEAWYVVDAAPGSRIYAGLKPGVDQAEFSAAIATGKVVDCLESFQPMPGDFVFLPAGKVHAVGGGVFFAEIQQTSDATFRLFDWNRRDAQGKPRTLHIDEGLAAIRWNQKPNAPISTDDSMGKSLVACPYFAIDRIAWPSSRQVGGTGRMQALVVTAGQGRFANGEFLMAGDVWILPAAMPTVELAIESPLAGILCTLPDGGET